MVYKMCLTNRVISLLNEYKLKIHTNYQIDIILKYISIFHDFIFIFKKYFSVACCLKSIKNEFNILSILSVNLCVYFHV